MASRRQMTETYNRYNSRFRIAKKMRQRQVSVNDKEDYLTKKVVEIRLIKTKRLGLNDGNGMIN
jgi:hypothetical protein